MLAFSLRNTVFVRAARGSSKTSPNSETPKLSRVSLSLPLISSSADAAARGRSVSAERLLSPASGGLGSSCDPRLGMENMLGFPEQLLKAEVDSPPLSPRSDDEEEEETEPDDSDGEEAEGGDGAGAGAGAGFPVSGGGPPLKKGPWTPEEDKRLRTYVEANGEGNWNHVQRNAGLNRCGKSCRLRWANHLRPHLKKGPFSEEEEQKIIELHAMYGNKWARMASEASEHASVCSHAGNGKSHIPPDSIPCVSLTPHTKPRE